MLYLDLFPSQEFGMPFPFLKTNKNLHVNISNTLEAGSRWDGSLSIKGGLMILGKFKGVLSGEKPDVVVGKTGDVTITENLNVGVLSVEGGGITIQGNLVADRLLIAKDSLLHVEGKIQVKQMEMESGARIHGLIETLPHSVEEVSPRKEGSSSIAKNRLLDVQKNPSMQEA